jgi:hypothetical protein
MRDELCIVRDAWTATLNAGASSTDEQVFLVSQVGKKFAVHAKLAKASSEYFVGAFESGMKETGKFLGKIHVEREALLFPACVFVSGDYLCLLHGTIDDDGSIKSSTMAGGLKLLSTTTTNPSSV